MLRFEAWSDDDDNLCPGITKILTESNNYFLLGSCFCFSTSLSGPARDDMECKKNIFVQPLSLLPARNGSENLEILTKEENELQ